MAQTVVFDTNILVQAFEKLESDHQFILLAITQKKFLLGWDTQGSICKEYEKNLYRSENYRKWLQKVQQLGQISYVGKSSLPVTHKQFLETHGCHEASDHGFIGVAFHSGKILVSEDSDIGKGPKGHQPPHMEALNYLTTKMGLSVYDAKEACEHLA